MDTLDRGNVLNKGISGCKVDLTCCSVSYEDLINMLFRMILKWCEIKVNQHFKFYILIMLLLNHILFIQNNYTDNNKSLVMCSNDLLLQMNIVIILLLLWVPHLFIYLLIYRHFGSSLIFSL